MSFKDGDVVAQIIGHGAGRHTLSKRVIFKATPTRVELRMHCTTAGAKPCGSGKRYRQDNGNRTPWCHLPKGHEGPHVCGEHRWR